MLKEYLSPEDIENIKNHKYQTTGYSWLDKKIDPFWNYCANSLPYFLTPNMVTLIGVLFQVSAIILIFFYDVTLSKDIPLWLIYYFIFVTFFGQTTDAIDGKHARNTKRSSPLGQMMDHGCDAFSNSFLIIYASQGFKYSSTLYTLVTQILVQINFYFYNWDENVTGIMMTQFNNFGITEFQFLAMTLMLLPAVFGTYLISEANFLFGFSFSKWVCFINLFLGFKGVVHLFLKNIKTKQDLIEKAYPIPSLIVLIVAELLVVNLKLFKEYTLWIILINAVFFGYLTSRVIVKTMTHKPIERFNFENLIYMIVIVISILSDSIWVEIGLYLTYSTYISFQYFRYMLSIMAQIMRTLNLNF